MLLGIFEPINDAGCDNRILNSLVRFLFEILGEKGVRLNGRGDAQQFLEEEGGKTIQMYAREERPGMIPTLCTSRMRS